jgi:hypothetical protein
VGLSKKERSAAERSGAQRSAAERGTGDLGTGKERGAEVQKIGGAWSGILARSRFAHMLWPQRQPIADVMLCTTR